jgi:hypothetical protein
VNALMDGTRDSYRVGCDCYEIVTLSSLVTFADVSEELATSIPRAGFFHSED